MRMWMVNPALMCRQHLLGEHVEIHMLIGSMKRNKSLKGFIELGLLEPSSVSTRHAALVAEMQTRGYKHQSSIDDAELSSYLDSYDDAIALAMVDSEASLKDLYNRCPNFKARAQTNDC